MNKKQSDKTCVCGCGRPLVPGKTGHNFATAACVLRVLLADKAFSAIVGEEHILTALKKNGVKTDGI